MSVILFINFKQSLLASFDDQLKSRAFVVAEKTNIQPRIIPLPQGEEVFSIIYNTAYKSDTLFASPQSAIVLINKKDSSFSAEGYRGVSISETLENGGTITINFALPSSGIERKIRKMELLITLVLPAGFILAILLAYWLSYSLIKPVKQVINLANNTNINNNTALLEEPETNNELKELIVSFNRMLLRIKEQSGRQTAFFASASHELRTPLSVMHTRLEMLMKDNTDQEVRSVYGSQLKEVQRLTKMVNDFLLLSELRSGNMIVLPVTCNLPEIISDSLQKFKSKWLAKQLLFKISYQPAETSYDVFADESKLQIVVDNLLENAIKYSPERSHIDMLIEKKSTEIIFTMTNKIRYDINPMIADVKNEFYHSKPLHGEGFGLGLWIANQLATMLEMEMFIVIREKEYFETSIVMNALNSPA